MSKPRLGEKVRDRVTGFEGIVTSITEWLNGCIRVSVQAEQKKDGTVPDPQYIDVEQVDVIGDGIRQPQRATGGDRPAPQRATDPTR